MEILAKVGFGCVALTIQPSLNKALYLLDVAFDNGIRNFDTAPVYGQGYSEIILGKFIANKRDQINITTKFGLGNVNYPKIPAVLALPLHNFRKSLSSSQSKTRQTSLYTKTEKRVITKQQIEHDFLLSLKRLNTDYIDNYLLHEGTPSFLSDDALDFVFMLKSTGRIKKIGLGVCHKNLEDISEEEIHNWDILQYENNFSINSGIIYSKFPEKKHIHHSILKNVNHAEKVGNLLANNLLTYPEASILFSTSKPNHLSANLKEMIKSYKSQHI
ncbi:Aldo/keto reductase family protein [compost metagenome]